MTGRVSPLHIESTTPALVFDGGVATRWLKESRARRTTPNALMKKALELLEQEREAKRLDRMVADVEAGKRSTYNLADMRVRYGL